jgi:hypothetical protein
MKELKNFSELLGKTLTNITSSHDEIIFTLKNKQQYRLYHEQSCCENVSIEDINGDLNDLLNTPITLAEETTDTNNPKKHTYNEGTKNEYTSEDDSSTWTFYKLATIKGYVNIRWYGSSNGYYSEGVDFEKIN